MTRLPRALCALVVASTLGGFALAQEPQGPPPPSGGSSRSGADVLELLPDLGRIGAEVGALGGASWNPYGAGRGYGLAGFIDLPLSRAPGGKLSYEILLGFSDATSEPFTITEPARRLVRSRLTLLDTSPFGLKYTITRLDHARLRPYLDAGLEVVVVMSQEEAEDGGGGLVAQAPELAARGLPTGQGTMELGFHAGGGLEVRLSRGLSLNLDYRYTRLGGARLQVAGGGLGIHW